MKNTLSGLALFAILALGIFGFSTSASAEVPHEITLVSKCSQDVYVSLAAHLQSIGNFYWVTEGWIIVEPGQTKKRRVAPSRYAYVEAHLKNQKLLTGKDAVFCTSDKPYSSVSFDGSAGNSKDFVVGADQVRKRAGTCDGAGGELKSFQKVDFKDGAGLIFNLTCN